jgi:hypothetical protein
MLERDLGDKANAIDSTWIPFRTRLIGLAALSAAVQSDVFHTSLSDFRQQAEIVLPALMQNLWLGDMDDLKLQ